MSADIFLLGPSVEKSIAGDKLVPIKETCPRSHTGGVATPPGFAKLVAGCTHQRRATYQSYLERGGGGSTYIPHQNAYSVLEGKERTNDGPPVGLNRRSSESL